MPGRPPRRARRTLRLPQRQARRGLHRRPCAIGPPARIRCSGVDARRRGHPKLRSHAAAAVHAVGSRPVSLWRPACGKSVFRRSESVMDRRKFVGAVASNLLAAPLAAFGQTKAKVTGRSTKAAGSLSILAAGTVLDLGPYANTSVAGGYLIS